MHPGIVPVHTVGEEHGLPFYANQAATATRLAKCYSAALGDATLEGERRQEALDDYALQVVERLTEALEQGLPPSRYGELGDAAFDDVEEHPEYRALARIYSLEPYLDGP